MRGLGPNKPDIQITQSVNKCQVSTQIDILRRNGVAELLDCVVTP